MIPDFNHSGVLPPFLPGQDPTAIHAVAPYRVNLIDFVEKFCTSAKRHEILTGFIEYRIALKQIGIDSGFQWVDGSFVENIETTKGRDPSDLDLITFAHRPAPHENDADWLNFVNANLGLFSPAHTKKSFHCDGYYIDLNLPPVTIVNRTSYWFGLFSHQRDTFYGKECWRLICKSKNRLLSNFLLTEVIMPRKLRIDSLKAELISVKQLLVEAQEIGDPVGQIQYEQRLNSIIKEIESTDGVFDTLASVAIYFGGKPVYGSRGISAEFACVAIEEFQHLISKVQAINVLGKIGERGKVPEVANTDLMITEVTKGSFGFILEELTDQAPLFDSSLKNTVDLVSKIIAKTCDTNEECFEEILPQIDSRVLISLKKFLVNLDANAASLRIVENDQEFIINEESAHRGRVRTESTVIKEEITSFDGVFIGFLPDHRKFEFQLADGEILYGTATVEATDQYTTLLKQGVGVINESWRVNVEVRNIKPLNRPEKQVFKLKEFIQKLEPIA